jgi:hypothetical protein
MVGTAGCGGGDDSKFKNEPRPPTPVQLTGVITDKTVTVSPDTLPLAPKEGAAQSQADLPTPIILTISNQTGDPHSIKLTGKSNDGKKQIEATVPPINPSDTAQLQQSLPPGTYTISATNPKGAVAASQVPDPATLRVNNNRQTSSGELLLP